ncbi:MAG: hypothetical protein Q8918_13945 [Bacteroidota bacterium]|nr:hypothetical protein [Bacteroidota bacterium]MDP4251203.1 hypothetical protein [Bacteroidota bacterium]
MYRNKFLSLIGLSFMSTIFPSAKGKPKLTAYTNCNDPVTPPVPEGPYYKNEHLNRIDITENKKGIPIDYIFRVEDKNCMPIKDALVDIWQCDAEGHYSDFDNENSIGQTWLRGYQKTNKDGECKFTSIFPGWYAKRITHLHAKVHIGSTTVLTTNFFFPKDIESEVYRSPLYPKGANPLTVLQDFELKVDKDTSRHDTLLMKVTKNKKDRLMASYTIAVM